MSKEVPPKKEEKLEVTPKRYTNPGSKATKAKKTTPGKVNLSIIAPM